MDVTGGIVLTKKAEQYFRPFNTTLDSSGMALDPSYFWMAIGYATVFALITKLLAVAMQQKLIGGLLGKRVGVRRAINVNSDFMRTAKLILTDPAALTKGKVLILVGGPDWPTSVTTGILGLDILPMLIGT